MFKMPNVCLHLTETCAAQIKAVSGNGGIGMFWADGPGCRVLAVGRALHAGAMSAVGESRGCGCRLVPAGRPAHAGVISADGGPKDCRPIDGWGKGVAAN